MYLNASECLVHGQRGIDATVLLFAFTRRWYRGVPANHSARLATSHSETWIIWLNFQNVLQIQRIGSSLTYSFKRCFLKLRPRWSATKTIWLKKSRNLRKLMWTLKAAHCYDATRFARVQTHHRSAARKQSVTSKYPKQAVKHDARTPEPASVFLFIFCKSLVTVVFEQQLSLKHKLHPSVPARTINYLPR